MVAPRPALVAVCTWLAACGAAPGQGGHTGGGSPTADTGDPAGSVRLSGVRWVLAWDPTGLQRGDGWTTTTAEGATVQLSAGWLVTSELHLEPCATGSGTAGPPPPHAGSTHPSNLSAAWAEDLVALQPATVDTLDFAAEPFCGAGLFFARADGATRNLPSEPALDGLSLVLEGAWQPPGDDTWHALSVATALPHLATLGVEADVDRGTTAVATLTRTPARAFDGVDLSGEDPDVSGLAVLRNLAAGSMLTLEAP